jgi:pimeloyl-ACP methyl ester carboxylesterase
MNTAHELIRLLSRSPVARLRAVVRLSRSFAVVALVVSAANGQGGPATGGAGISDVIIRFSATDGTPLEGKLSVPTGSTRVPVVFFLHGAGPRHYDHPVRFRDTDGQIRTEGYLDYYVRELAQLGLGFFRISKRGCAIDSAGRPSVDRAVFSKATPTVLLDDYTRALEALRKRSEIDPARVVIGGASEGTRLAPQLALAAPEGIVGLMLTSYASDNQQNTVVWQNTTGVWRNVTKLIPAASDGSLTKVEHAEALAADGSLGARLPFAALDANRDSVVTEAEMIGLVKPRLDAILKAVEDRNDDFLWTNLLNLSSAYLLDGWQGEPTSAYLLRLTVPIGIFHGDLDGTTRVEGVHETAAAFRAAGKSSLTVRTYPGHDHDLNWTPQSVRTGGPVPLRDAFRFAAGLASAR